MDLPDSDRGDFSCRRAVDSSSFIYFDGSNFISFIINCFFCL